MWKIAIEKRTVFCAALGAALLSAAPISLRWSPERAPSLALDRANARTGQPLSAGSVAGVHRRVYRRTARGAHYGGAVAAGAAGAYYSTAASNGYGSGYSPYGSSGYNNLYSYSPPANAAAAANTEGGMGYNVQNSTLAAEAPELYAACLNRTYGACPGQ